MVRIYLAQDPETQRITAQDRPFRPEDFPPRGGRRTKTEPWEQREASVPDVIWHEMLAGDVSPARQDELHREWWGE